MKDQVLQFLKRHSFCVISSVNQTGKPESAFVAFSASGQLELLIGTSSKSRKYKNISQIPDVSVVVADESGEVQYEGQAKELNAKDIGAELEKHFAKVPGSTKYRQDPTQVWIKIEPTWIRYIEHGEVDTVNEIKDFS